MAGALLDAIRSHKPNFPDSSKRWVGDIDLAIRKDEVSADRLTAAADFAHRHDATGFWRGNILSGAALRRQLQALEIRMARTKPKKSTATGWAPPSDSAAFDESGNGETVYTSGGIRRKF